MPNFVLRQPNDSLGGLNGHIENLPEQIGGGTDISEAGERVILFGQAFDYLGRT